jgi:hypothetical protein
MESGWILWVSVLLAWAFVGLVVAYVFGGFVRRSETSKQAVLVHKAQVRHLRRQKRTNAPRHASTLPGIARAASGRTRR